MKLLLSNLDPSTTEADLRAVLVEFGFVGEIVFETGVLDSLYAVISTEDHQTAENLITYMQGDIINGRPINIKIQQLDALLKSGHDFPPQTKANEA